jgi:hypothetical protein
MAEKLAEWIESKDCINAWAWNEWLWACLPILYSNRNLVGSYALPSAATVAKTETENGTTLNLNPKKLKQAKTETKNGTTLNLNLKKAETESENGRFILHGDLCPSKFILDGA